MRDYLHHAYHLTEATKKEAPNKVVWTDVMCSDFSFLCTALSDSCVLHIPVCGEMFVLQTHASLKGISGVLSVLREGQELPVAFYSRKLRPAETRYSATEVECLAIIKSIEHFDV